MPNGSRDLNEQLGLLICSGDYTRIKIHDIGAVDIITLQSWTKE